jgi:hypothetical protein
MRLADQTLSIADFRRLGAFEIYRAAEVAAFARGKTLGTKKALDAVDDGVAFRLGDLFAAPTKVYRLIWLARRPGVLPWNLLRHFAHAVAAQCQTRLAADGELEDIRARSALVAHQEHLDGSRHARSLTPFREAARQAALDHQRFGSERAADGCRVVVAALDPDACEAGAEAALGYLSLFGDAQSEAWLRTCLSELIEQSS